MSTAPDIVILTGAGVSAESGLGTFRDVGGLWSQYDLSEVATPEGYARNPKLVLDFYNARRENCVSAEPNGAHRALAELGAALGARLLLITQNIDDLHERGGSEGVVHMHGEIRSALCTACRNRWDWDGDMATDSFCPACATVGSVRPDIVWFGEMPYHMDRIAAAIEGCALFVAIGTSGDVYPAAGFVDLAREAGARTLEINLERTDSAGRFDGHLTGKASLVVPAWVRSLL